MIFKVGDRVKINPRGNFSHQAKDHPGLGTITVDNGRGAEQWWHVLMDDGYDNAYRNIDLIVGYDPMPPPEMELEEIEMAESLLQALQKA